MLNINYSNPQNGLLFLLDFTFIYVPKKGKREKKKLKYTIFGFHLNICIFKHLLFII